MKTKTKLTFAIFVLGAALLPLVMATTYTISLYEMPQMEGEFFTIDYLTFTELGGDVYVNLDSSWWKLSPDTYILHEETTPGRVQLITNINCEVIESEALCVDSENGSGGGPN